MTSADDARDRALAWLTGRLQWERLLSDLHRRADEPTANTTARTTVELDEPAKAA